MTSCGVAGSESIENPRHPLDISSLLLLAAEFAQLKQQFTFVIVTVVQIALGSKRLYALG